jgi:thiol:disulfide interchange protein DsbG
MSQARTVAALTFALLSGTSLSARAEDYPKQIEMATQGGGKVVQTFQAASQLKGWVLSKGGRYTMVFTTPDGKTLIVGELIDESGKNLTAEYAHEYFPKPDLAALFPALEDSAHVVEGTQKSPKSVIYVFFDPNCPFCHLTWKALQPYEKAGLQVRWLPVAYLMQTSAGRAAAILEAKNRTTAFRQNEEKYNMEKHEGGIDALSKPADATMRQLQANNELMQKFGAFGTPALVWKDGQGKIQMKSGLPRLSELPAITGLPEQPETDPDLARFR